MKNNEQQNIIKNRYQEKKNNGNVSPPPLILEKESFLQVNNKVNLPSSSSSSSSFSSSFNIFPLTSTTLSSYLHNAKIIDYDENKEDAIDRLLKLRDKVPMQKDANSVNICSIK
jgi:hypothetical protein